MPLPRVDNEYLFRRLAVRIGATLACDVGAFDGTHAKRFRRAGLRVIAFEANPHCFAALASDPSVDAAGIHLVNAAAGTRTKSFAFTSSHRPTNSGSPRTSIGSVLEPCRVTASKPHESVAVAGMVSTACSLWKPARSRYGSTSRVRGTRSSKGSPASASASRRQHRDRNAIVLAAATVGADVVAALRELGFTPIARGPGGDLQFDVVFVNDRWLRAARFTIRTCIAEAVARATASALRGCLRRWLHSA